MAGAREAEIRQNFTYFSGIVAGMMDQHAGRFALIQNCKLIEVYDTAGEAVATGARMFGEAPFSVQRVINRPIDLGFLSHATDIGVAV